jgi:hypothetical protein
VGAAVEIEGEYLTGTDFLQGTQERRAAAVIAVISSTTTPNPAMEPIITPASGPPVSAFEDEGETMRVFVTTMVTSSLCTSADRLDTDTPNAVAIDCKSAAVDVLKAPDVMLVWIAVTICCAMAVCAATTAVPFPLSSATFPAGIRTDNTTIMPEVEVEEEERTRRRRPDPFKLEESDTDVLLSVATSMILEIYTNRSRKSGLLDAIASISDWRISAPKDGLSSNCCTVIPPRTMGTNACASGSGEEEGVVPAGTDAASVPVEERVG